MVSKSARDTPADGVLLRPKWNHNNVLINKLLFLYYQQDSEIRR